MNLKELCRQRYSVRAYLPKEVEKEKIDYILECARLAPSACNKQPWFFYVITSEREKENLRKTYDREWFKSAPLYIVVCGNYEESWKRSNTDNKDHGDIDAAIACEHICLAAEDVGLGTCWVCNFNPYLLKEILNLPEKMQPVAIFPIGYADKSKEKAPEKSRKDISEITKWI